MRKENRQLPLGDADGDAGRGVLRGATTTSTALTDVQHSSRVATFEKSKSEFGALEKTSASPSRSATRASPRRRPGLAVRESINSPLSSTEKASKSANEQVVRSRSLTGEENTPKDTRDGRREWESRVAHAARENPADPLAVWLAYIRWMQVQSPPDLPPIVERAMRAFLPREAPECAQPYAAQYRDDARYVRLCIQHADACADPTEMFTLMRQHQIGQRLALFYEAYAVVLETKRQYALADRCYALGLERSAQPVDRLQRRHAEFKARMMRRLERQQREERKNARKASPEQERRPPIGGASETSARASGSVRVSASTPSSRTGAPGGDRHIDAPPAPFQVYTDEDAGGEQLTVAAPSAVARNQHELERRPAMSATPNALHTSPHGDAFSDSDPDTASSQAQSPRQAPPSPTINTKLALAEVESMFCMPLPFENAVETDHEHSPPPPQSTETREHVSGMPSAAPTPIRPVDVEQRGQRLVQTVTDDGSDKENCGVGETRPEHASATAAMRHGSADESHILREVKLHTDAAAADILVPYEEDEEEEAKAVNLSTEEQAEILEALSACALHDDDRPSSAARSDTGSTHASPSPTVSSEGVRREVGNGHGRDVVGDVVTSAPVGALDGRATRPEASSVAAMSPPLATADDDASPFRAAGDRSVPPPSLLPAVAAMGSAHHSRTDESFLWSEDEALRDNERHLQGLAPVRLGHLSTITETSEHTGSSTLSGSAGHQTSRIWPQPPASLGNSPRPLPRLRRASAGSAIRHGADDDPSVRRRSFPLTPAVRDNPDDDCTPDAIVHPYDPQVRALLDEHLAAWFAQLPDTQYCLLERAPDVRIGAPCLLGAEAANEAARRTLYVYAELAPGDTSTTYLVEWMQPEDDMDSRHRDGASESSSPPLYALQVQSPSSPWPYYIARTVHERWHRLHHESQYTDDDNDLYHRHVSWVEPVALYDADECSCLVMRGYDQGSLDDLLQLLPAGGGGGLEPAVVAFLVATLLTAVGRLHRVGVIHMGLRPDKVLLRLQGGLGAHSGIALLPSSTRSIDTRLLRRVDALRLPSSSSRRLRCRGGWVRAAYRPPAMRAGQPWSYDVDWYAVAVMVRKMAGGAAESSTREETSRKEWRWLSPLLHALESARPRTGHASYRQCLQWRDQYLTPYWQRREAQLHRALLTHSIRLMECRPDPSLTTAGATESLN